MFEFGDFPPCFKDILPQSSLGAIISRVSFVGRSGQLCIYIVSPLFWGGEAVKSKHDLPTPFSTPNWNGKYTGYTDKNHSKISSTFSSFDFFSFVRNILKSVSNRSLYLFAIETKTLFPVKKNLPLHFSKFEIRNPACLFFSSGKRRGSRKCSVMLPPLHVPRTQNKIHKRPYLPPSLQKKETIWMRKYKGDRSPFCLLISNLPPFPGRACIQGEKMMVFSLSFGWVRLFFQMGGREENCFSLLFGHFLYFPPSRKRKKPF